MMSHPTSFSFNCTTPSDSVNFVSSPPVRGTLDIVWGCLGVILLSTWISDRGNVTRRPSATGRFARVKRPLIKFFKDCKLTMLTILAPELVLSAALERLWLSRSLYRGGLPYAVQDGVDWSRPKTYYAVMGGFTVKFDRIPPSNSGQNVPGDGRNDYTQLLSTPNEQSEKPHAEQLDLFHDDVLYLRRIGVLDTMPTLSNEDLEDRNKSNALVETLAIIQTMWLMIQVIVRYTRGLTVTQLEVATLAFAVLRFITGILDWERPKGVHTQVELHAVRWLTTAEYDEVMADRNGDFNDHLVFWSCAVVGALFGGLHCLAWNEHFPTSIERVLWRVASVLTTVLPFAMPLLGVVTQLKIGSYFFDGVPIAVVYGVARLYIIAETVRGLFYQPPSTFVSTWTVNFPHIG